MGGKFTNKKRIESNFSINIVIITITEIEIYKILSKKFVSQKLKMEVKTETDYGHTKYAYFVTEYCLKYFNYTFKFIGIAF